MPAFFLISCAMVAAASAVRRPAVFIYIHGLCALLVRFGSVSSTGSMDSLTSAIRLHRPNSTLVTAHLGRDAWWPLACWLVLPSRSDDSFPHLLRLLYAEAAPGEML